MIYAHRTANKFLEVCRSLLQEKEAENNLILGLAATLNRDINYYSSLPPLFLSVHDNAKCVCACLQTPPKNLIIYGSRDHLDHSIKELCEYLIDHNLEIPGVIGPKDTVVKFTELWTSLKNVSSRILAKQLVYKLDRLNEVPQVHGKLREATISDLYFVIEWVKQLHAETIQQISSEEAKQISVKKIEDRAFYIWEADQPVSMAAWTRPTQNGVTISSVYTPIEFRTRGYATSCVAKLSEILLSKYKFCTLFTDLSNPTSNNLYQKIGYKQIDQVLQIKFD